MSNVATAANSLEAALKTVEGLRVIRDPGGQVDPPAAVLGAPRLTWESMCADPTAATFPVWVLTTFDERAVERLWDLVVEVAEAIDTELQASVTTADPDVFSLGGQELPAYRINVEVAL
jgi:hypothetical protein